MERNVLSYAKPTTAQWRPPNPVMTVGLWIGGVGWGLVMLSLLIRTVLDRLGRGALLGDALDVPMAVGGILMPSGFLLGFTAVAIGPAGGGPCAGS